MGLLNWLFGESKPKPQPEPPPPAPPPPKKVPRKLRDELARLALYPFPPFDHESRPQVNLAWGVFLGQFPWPWDMQQLQAGTPREKALADLWSVQQRTSDLSVLYQSTMPFAVQRDESGQNFCQPPGEFEGERRKAVEELYRVDPLFQEVFNRAMDQLRPVLVATTKIRASEVYAAAVEKSEENKLPAEIPVGDIYLGQDIDRNEIVSIGLEERQVGMHVIGLSGSGKTTFLLQHILQDIDAGRGLAVIDPHGDLIQDILKRREISPERLVVFDPSWFPQLVGLNLFECADSTNPAARALAVSNVMGILLKLWGPDGLFPSWGVQIQDLFWHIAQTFVEAKEYTLVDVPAFLEKPAFRAKVLQGVRPELRDYWETNYDPRQDRLDYRNSVLNKIRVFTDHEVVAGILGQSRSTIRIRQIMDEGKVFLVRLAQGQVGKEGVTLLGSLVLTQIHQALLSRSQQDKKDRRPFSLYVDEFALFATPDFNSFFSEGRKFGIQTVVAHQYLKQLDTSSREAALSVPNRVIFAVSPDDAQALRRGMVYTPPGPKPILVKDPLRTLHEKRHANGWVEKYMDCWIRPIFNFDDLPPSQKRYSSEPGFYRTIKFLIPHVNEYLIKMMEKQPSLNSIEEFNLWADLARYGTFLLDPEFQIKHRDIYSKFVSDEELSTMWSSLLAWLFVQRDIEDQRSHWKRDEPYFFSRLSLSAAEVFDRYLQMRAMSSENLQFAILFMSDFRRLGAILARTPLYDSRALGAPTLDREQTDLLTVLTHLPVGQAVVRLKQNWRSLEYRISVPPLEDQPLLAGHRREHLRQQALAYTRLYDQVLADTRTRQQVGSAADNLTPRRRRSVEL